MQEDWKKLFKPEKNKPYFTELQKFINSEYDTKTIYPPKNEIYHAFDLTSYKDTNVVILGQDPYHGAHQAHGLSFSVCSEKAKFPPSLRNIFTELKSDLGIERTNKNLTDWVKQGVLMLNTVLTVEEGKAASHRGKGWEIFTNNIMNLLNDKDEQIIFLLWGADAKKKTTLLTNPIHKIITGVHPSPLSAYNGFFGSKPFSKINEYLKAVNKNEINW